MTAYTEAPGMRIACIAMLIAAVLAAGGCRQKGQPNVASSDAKIEGPDVKQLSHEELMAVLHECHQYGSSDDLRVKYTTRYCSAAQSAHAMEGYTKPSTAVVDPTINKLH